MNFTLRVSGFLQQRFRTVRIIGKAFQRVIMRPDSGGNHTVFRLGVSHKNTLDNDVPVNRHADGFADVHILQVLVIFIHQQVGHPDLRHADNPEFGICLVGGRYNCGIQDLQVNDIQFTVPELQVLGRGIRNHLDHQFFYAGFFAPVFLVIYQRVVVIGHPFRDNIGTRADCVPRLRSEFRRVCHGFRVHNGHGRRGQFRRETRIRCGQRYGKMRVIRDAEAFKGIRFSVHYCFTADNFQRNFSVFLCRLQQTLKAELNIRRGQRTAVGENDAFPQGKAVSQPVFADGVVCHQALHNFGSTGNRPCLKKPVKDVHRNQIIVCGFRNVHGGNIIPDSGPKETGFGVVRKRSSGEQKSQRQNHCSKFPHVSIHPFLSA